MARPMFEYTKTILKKVSFDSVLFNRELQKALKHLLPEEVKELRIWIISLTQINPDLSSCLTYLES